MAVQTKKERRQRRKMHIRKHLSGTALSPRVSIFSSNRYLFAQVADDEKGICITGASEKLLKEKKDEKPIDRAGRFGEDFGNTLKGMKISSIVFDRGGYKYHGRVKSFADGLRKSGLKF